MAYYCAGEGRYDMGQSYHFREFHVFMNWMEYRNTDCEKIHTGHHVHIFITNDRFINQSLRNFVHKCQFKTKKPVIIHIPSYEYMLKNSLTVALRFLSHDIYKILWESKPVEFLWGCSYNSKAYKEYGAYKANTFGFYEDAFLVINMNGKTHGVCYNWRHQYPSWRHKLETGNKKEMQKAREFIESNTIKTIYPE